MKNIGVIKERLIDGILLPYSEEVKRDLSLPNDQKKLLIWDAFTGQNTDSVKKQLSELTVPKNLTHLLQPLDLITNASFTDANLNYFTTTILN